MANTVDRYVVVDDTLNEVLARFTVPTGTKVVDEGNKLNIQIITEEDFNGLDSNFDDEDNES